MISSIKDRCCNLFVDMNNLFLRIFVKNLGGLMFFC